MARTFTHEPIFFSAVPNVLTFGGLQIASKGTFILAAVSLNESSVYQETNFYYADASGNAVFDASPFFTRAFDVLFKNPDIVAGPGGISSGRTFLYNYFEFSIEAIVTDAVDGEIYTDHYESMYVSYGGVPLNEITKWRKELELSGGVTTATRMLTRATSFEVNTYLPSAFYFRPLIIGAIGSPVFSLVHADTLVSAGDWPLGTGGAYAISVLAAYPAVGGNGDYLWYRKSGPSTKQIYKIKINNDATVLDRIKSGKCVYLRWLNSLGGFSYGLFKAKAEGIAIASDVIGKQYDTIVPSGLVNQKDFQIMNKKATKTLNVGIGQVGWDRMYDLLDLLTSIDVCIYSIYETGDVDRTNNWTPVLVSGGAGVRRDYNYNDFTCDITFPELFTQKR